MRVSLATLAFLLTLAVRHSEANEGESGYSHCSEQRELRGWRLKVGVGSVGGCSEEVWSGKHGLGFLPNRQCLSQGCLPISGRGSLLPPPGWGKPASENSLPGLWSQPREADPEPSECLLSCAQTGAEFGREETIKDHALFTA